MNNIVKRIWPIIIIVGVWFLFSYPYFLKNKTPYSSTYQVNNFAPWDAYPGFTSPVKNGAMPDVTTQIYPWKHFVIQTYKEGQIPLWNPNSFSGTPHLANYQSAVLSPFNMLFFILPFVDAWSILVLLQPLLAGIFMYLFVRSIGISKSGSIIASIGFMFCGFIVTWMDYATLSYAILFLPLALFFIESFLQFGKKRFLLFLSLTFPLSFFSGHFSISVYFALIVFCYIIYKFFTLKQKNASCLCLLYSFLGLLLTLPQILPTAEFYSQSLRSTLFQALEVIPWAYIPTLIAPDFFGNPVTRNDWFGHYAEWNAYIGVLPFMLAFYSFHVKEKKKILFFFITAFLAFCFAFPTPLLSILVSLHIPVISTSAASRIIVLFSFSLLVMSGFGFDQLTKDITNKKRMSIFFWLLFFAFLLGLLWFVVISKQFIPDDKINIARQNLILPSILFFGISILTFISFFSFMRKKAAIAIICGVFICICAFDMLRFSTKWQPFDPKNLAFTSVPVSTFLQKISDNQKVIGNFGAETSVYFNAPSLEGYDALYIRRYGEFMASLTDGKYKQSARSVVSFPRNSDISLKVIDLLNVRYIVHKVSDDFTGWTFPYWQNPGRFSEIYNDGRYRVYKNNFAFPHAFAVYAYSVKKGNQEILNKMFSKDFDLSKAVVLEENPGFTPQKNLTSAIVKITTYTPNAISISVDSPIDGLLFLSDAFYPGWEAYNNNKKEKIFRADFAFRAVRIYKGKNTISFMYNPVSFRIGLLLGFGAFFGILLLTVLPRKLNFFPET